MKLEFAKYYDITNVAKEHNKEYEQYDKIFVCVDTNTFWIGRIQKGWRNDDVEGYVEDENSVILERNNIEKAYKGESIDSHKELLAVLDQDDFGNWDVENTDSVEEATEMLDGGFGILVYEK